jgi:hypothetical protein
MENGRRSKKKKEKKKKEEEWDIILNCSQYYHQEENLLIAIWGLYSLCVSYKSPFCRGFLVKEMEGAACESK